MIFFIFRRRSRRKIKKIIIKEYYASETSVIVHAG